jgi:EamA-like transporter family
VTARPSSFAPTHRTGTDAAGNLGLFILMSLIWGATWVAVKVGVTAVPPIFFAGLRYALVGALLAVLVRDFSAPFGRGFVGRTLLTGTLVNVGTYSLLFLGHAVRRIGRFRLDQSVADSRRLVRPMGTLRGRRAPVASCARAGARGGGAGRAILERGHPGGEPHGAVGALAIVAATFCYCLGTVLSRPPTAVFTPLRLTAAQAMVGAPG